MNALRQAAEFLSRWIDDVASAILSLDAAFRPTTEYRIAERDDSTFDLILARRRSAPRPLRAGLRFTAGKFVDDSGDQAHLPLTGAQIELVLARRRFMFRTMELPNQASNFLDAIVRSQIDRLTPWSSAQAAFGFSAPKQSSNGRIRVSVAATSRSAVMPFLDALEALRPNAILISASSEAEDNGGRTIVFSKDTNRETSSMRMRRVLAAAPAAVGLAAILAFAASSYVSAELEDSQLRISKQIAERRAALSIAAGSIDEDGTAKLAQQKRESPAAVLVLEQLSQILPDDTYLTELHIADGKMEITGVTREAASLIRIIEQTEQFKNATFSAPTTRAPLGTGEQFHIAAEIVPYFPAFP